MFSPHLTDGQGGGAEIKCASSKILDDQDKPATERLCGYTKGNRILPQVLLAVLKHSGCATGNAAAQGAQYTCGMASVTY